MLIFKSCIDIIIADIVLKGEAAMNKVNKNNLILAISACLIVFSIILVSVASIVEHKKEEKNDITTPSQAVTTGDKAPETNAHTNPLSTTAAPVTTPQATGAYKTGTYKIATKDDPLSLREYPDEGRVGEIPKGETVEVLVVYEEWGYVLYEGQNGWISLTLAELVSAKDVATTNKPGKYIINTQEDPLSIRTQITDGERSAEIPKGETVDILAVCKGDEGEYGLVEYDGTFGWLPFKFLKAA